MRRKLLCIVFACILLFVNSRKQTAHAAPLTDTYPLSAKLASIEKNFNETIEKYDIKSNKELLKIYKERLSFIQKMFQKNELLSDVPANEYIDKLINEIVSENSVLQPCSFQVAFSKSAIPNAASYGFGFIAFNAGLLTQLQNENQLVFILCHEMAHDYLRHMDNSIKKYLDDIRSKETQKELKSIKRQEYNRRTQLENLNLQIDVIHKRYSREKELEADSLAVLFMSNTKYDIKDALTSLALLDIIDDDTFDASEFMRKAFNSEEYPFNDKWLARDEGLLGGHAILIKDKKLEDSLKTHPDCFVRIQQLQKQINLKSNSSHTSNNAAFISLKEALPVQIITHYYNTKQYSQSLYYSLELLSRNDSDTSAIIYIANSLNQIYQAQKNHTLYQVSDVPAPGFKHSYNMLLQLIQNLRLNEIASINFHFLNKYKNTLFNNKEYTSALALCKEYISN